jgi:predicted transcriptional regulator
MHALSRLKSDAAFWISTLSAHVFAKRYLAPRRPALSIPSPDTELGRLVSEIVAAYVGNHNIEALAIPPLIQSVYAALARLQAGPAQPDALVQEPAVPIKKSVFPNYIICLEDGKKLKMLKRHLKVSYGLEPAEYRAKWGLPASYPMVAPNYAEQRSSVAKRMGLGLRPAARFVATEPAAHKIPEGRSGLKRPKAAKVPGEPRDS